MTTISHIVAVSYNGIIGKESNIPWHIPADLMYFKELTMNRVCIVGRKTYETIKHLKNRIFIVVTRNDSYTVNEGHHIVNSPAAAIVLAETLSEERIFIAGGAELYRETFQYADELFVTSIFESYDGDASYVVPSNFDLTFVSDIKKHNDIQYVHQIYKS